MTSQPPDRLARLTLTPKHSTRPGFITRVGGGGSREKPKSREKKATRTAPDGREDSNSDPETDLDAENVAAIADPLGVDDPHDLTVLNRKLYERKCRQVGVVPINLFIRHMEDTELSLRGRQCGPNGARALAAPLMLNRSLTKLDLGSNSVEDRGARHLVDKLIENVALQELNLSENNLTIEGAKFVCQLVLMNSNIRTLDVSGNHFGDKVAPLFAAMLTQCRTLLTLNLSNNELGAESGLLLGPAIASNDTLRELDLSWNHIRLKGACAIAKGIKENIRLLKVDLSWNGFGVDGAQALSITLAENPVLERLNLAGNRMSDVAVMHIATGLSRNEGLLELNMDKNPMTHVGAFGLIQAVFKSESCTLKTLHIKDIPVRDDFLDVLYELRTNREFDVSYLELNKRKQNNIQRTNTLLSYLKKKELTIYDLFASASEKTPPKEVSRDTFLDKLKTLSVPLSNRQLNEVAATLDTHKHGVLDLRPPLEKEGTLIPGSPTPASREKQLNQYVQTASGTTNQSEPTTTMSRHDNNQSEPSKIGNRHGNNKPGSPKHKGSKTASHPSNKPAGSKQKESATTAASRHGDDPLSSVKDKSTRAASSQSNMNDHSNVLPDSTKDETVRASSRLSNRSNHSNYSSKSKRNNTESPLQYYVYFNKYFSIVTSY